MKRKVLSLSLLASVGMLAFGSFVLTGCGNAPVSSATVLLNAKTMEVEVGSVKQLKASISKGYSGSVRWFTSNESICSVNDGYLFGISEGEAIVTASFGGGYADCVVTVTPNGGGGKTEKLILSDTQKSIKEGTSFTLTHNVYPADTTVEYSSDDTTIATLTNLNDGVEVNGIKEGSTTIRAVGSNGKVASCSVTVTSASSPTEYDIGVPTNLNYPVCDLVIGTPMLQDSIMRQLCADFNKLTGSNIRFSFVTYEENTGTSGYANASAMPGVFPYASDQTLTLSQFQALSPVESSDRTWIKNNMGEDAVAAAKLGSSTVGYPFSADNGCVMFYNEDYLTKEEAWNSTITELLNKASDNGLEFNYPVTNNGFFSAGALMTFTEGQSLYKMTPTATSYRSESTFKCAAGLKAAQLLHNITNHPAFSYSDDAPTTAHEVIATITDVSKVQTFKSQMGSKYAVAPLPYANSKQEGVRLGSYLGYKFFGVNAQLKDTKKQAFSVAKFLCSEYAQAERFKQLSVRPTLKSLQDMAKDEQHIAALLEEQACKSTIPLSAIASELWSATPTAVQGIRDCANTEAAFSAILTELDATLNKQA